MNRNSTQTRSRSKRPAESPQWAGAGLVIAALLWLNPAGALACGYCAYSMILPAFPFIKEVSIAFVGWRVLYAIWQLVVLRPEARSVLVWLITRTVALLFLFMNGLWAGVLIYCLASYAKAVVRFADLRRTSSRITEGTVYVFGVLSLLPIITSIPFVLQSYQEKSKLDDLGVYMRYVYPGTAPGRAQAIRYANDPGFDTERLRPYLTGDEVRMRRSAHLILEFRKKAEDLHRFREYLMTYDDPEFDPYKGSSYYLASWVQSVCGPDVSRKDELLAWFEANPLAADDSATPSPVGD